jgi:hypothetical protein
VPGREAAADEILRLDLDEHRQTVETDPVWPNGDRFASTSEEPNVFEMRTEEAGQWSSWTPVVERYSGLARLAAAGGEPVDAPGDTRLDGCGATVYEGSATELGVPEGTLRASMACGNPVAVADLRPGRPGCWTWAVAVASTCCCRHGGRTAMSTASTRALT